MTLEFDPIWPWSHVGDLLAEANTLMLVGVVGMACLALGLPFLLARRGLPFGMSPGLLLVRALAFVGTCLLLVLLGGEWGEAISNAALLLLFSLPFLVVGITIATYHGTGVPLGRLALILGLRLALLALVGVAMLRPRLAFTDTSALQTQLIIAVDASQSMKIRDEPESRSRWELLLDSLAESESALRRLREEHHVEVLLYRFADEVVPWENSKSPEGKQTATGTMLHYLYENREGQLPLRGLLVLSDGANNVTRYPAITEAERWGELPCPVQTFACGSTTTSNTQNDIALVGISPDPAPVPIKGKLLVTVTANAPGFLNREVRLRLFLDDKEVTARNAVLGATEGNTFTLECTAPSTPGEVALKVKLEDPKREGKPPAGDSVEGNNEITTFVQVAKEGVSVLLVDKPRAWEPQMITRVLQGDRRIRINPVLLRGGKPQRGNEEDLLELGRADRAYDVIIVGDVRADDLTALDLKRIAKLVENGAGFLMLGGYDSFGPSWKNTPIATMLPVELPHKGKLERDVRMMATAAGLAKFRYIMGVDDKDPERAWNDLAALEGITLLDRRLIGNENVLATSPEGKLILATRDHGEGRVLAFAGDTTHRWVVNEKGRDIHARFWRRMVMWLARQEDQQAQVRIVPDVRRVPTGTELGFRTAVRNKLGGEIPDASFEVEVIDPKGKTKPVSVVRINNRNRGTIPGASEPGIYRIRVRGKASDQSTGEAIEGESTARFLVYQDEKELTVRAANHNFLKKLARAGGGEFHRIEQLAGFLENLPNQPFVALRPKRTLWPDWSSSGWSPFLTFYLLVFVALLTGEWLLRRRWGMV